LKAIEEMVEELGLTNVQTHHGRVEEMVDNSPFHRGAYDLCVGRSVAPLPKFCFWIKDLLKKEDGDANGRTEGKLVYIVGGEIEEMVSSKAKLNIPINSLIGKDGYSDKLALVFSESDVSAIAVESGEKKVRKGTQKVRNKPRRRKNNSKGSWDKRDSSVRKQRGYDNFERYN